jgi:uncharacterized membrane protein
MTAAKRLSNIDIARGLVMIIMALDHVRDLLHADALRQNPVDLTTTTPVLFLTRWITHLCAPTFVFLSGASVYLAMQRSREKEKARSILWKRGLWLIVLEFTLVNFALWFDTQFRILIMQVIAAIGTGLIVLSFLTRVQPKKIAGIALAIIFLHNLLGLLPAPANPVLAVFFNLLFRPGLLQPSPDFIFFVAYPLIPWLGIMLLGYACGKLFEQSPADQQKKFRNIGLFCLLGFVVLRFINVYGDPAVWSQQKNAVFTLLSFVNVTKYPPSLLYDLLFLGMMFLFLAFAEKLPSRLRNVLEAYGRVPMFYYLLHLYFIRIAVFIMVFAQGFSWSDLRFGPFQFGRPEKASGIGLGGVYLVWIAVVALLYPLCRWYGKYKYNHPEKELLKYL